MSQTAFYPSEMIHSSEAWLFFYLFNPSVSPFINVVKFFPRYIFSKVSKFHS